MIFVICSLILKLPIIQGAQGIEGPSGNIGKAGKAGADGPPGAQGDVGNMGQQVKTFHYLCLSPTYLSWHV